MRYQKLSRMVLISLIVTSLQFVGTINSQEAFKSSPVAKDSFPLIYEAEYGNYVGLTLQISTSASNGQFLRMETTGSVTWNVNVDSSGWYNLKIQYQSPESDKVNNLIKNGVNWPMGFRWANSWIMVERLVALNAGSNTIVLACNQGGIDVDYLMIDTVTVIPEITPKNNVFYSRIPRDIFVKMNAYGREITSVSANSSPLSFEITPFPYEEDAWLVRIDSNSLSTLAMDKHDVLIEFDTGESTAMHLNVMPERTSSILTIIAPHVDHGNSVLFILPAGKTMLVDCGKAYWRDAVVIPLLTNNGITKLDYFIITHYHDDHDGGDKGATILSQFDVKQFYDYHSFVRGDIVDLEGVQMTILNAYDDGADENSRSLSFQLKYKGFLYVHGADIYSSNQRAIMSYFPNDLKAHVFFSNHHFHGSLDAEYIRAMDPCVVLVQAQEAIYARGAYTMTYLIDAVKWLKQNGGRFMDNLPAIEVGTTVIRVNNEDDWSYETYKDTLTPRIPFIPQNMH